MRKRKKIADYILNNPENIIHSTINDVAEDLHVADATVFRFCKRIGFKGFQAMKIALAAEIIEPIQQIHEEISELDDERTVMEKVFHSNIHTLKSTLNLIDETSIEQAVDLLLKAHRVDFTVLVGLLSLQWTLITNLSVRVLRHLPFWIPIFKLCPPHNLQNMMWRLSFRIPVQIKIR